MAGDLHVATQPECCVHAQSVQPEPGVALSGRGGGGEEGGGWHGIYCAEFCLHLGPALNRSSRSLQEDSSSSAFDEGFCKMNSVSDALGNGVKIVGFKTPTTSLLLGFFQTHLYGAFIQLAFTRPEQCVHSLIQCHTCWFQ